MIQNVECVYIPAELIDQMINGEKTMADFKRYLLQYDENQHQSAHEQYQKQTNERI